MLDKLKVIVKTSLSGLSGYGNDGIGICLALMRAGVDVYVSPLQVSAPLPTPVASLFTKRLDAPFDVLINHTDPSQMALTPSEVEHVDISVLWSMWEFSSGKNIPQKSKIKTKTKGASLYFGYDDNSVNSVKPYLNKKTKTDKLQGGYWPQDWPYLERDWYSEQFNFIMNGTMNLRKNPWVVLEAWRVLKENYPEFKPARLVLKTTAGSGLHPAMEKVYPDLRIIYDSWPQEYILKFYQQAHCLLAPSFGEGKNLPALEFMSTGGAVIATNWSGHSEWLHETYAYPLNYELCPLDSVRLGPDCQWAAADVNHLMELMLHVFRNRDDAKIKGEAASQAIPLKCSWDVVMDNFFRKIEDNFPDQGSIIHLKYQEGKDELERAGWVRD